MINLRYHVFSLMAVFAALAIGIVVGSNTVKSGLVDNLRGNVDRAEKRIADVEAENDALRDRDEQLDRLADEGAPLLSGELTGVPVLWITAPDVRGDVVEGLQTSADAAGAIDLGQVSLEDRLFDDDSLGVLADVLGVVEDDPDDARAAMGDELAGRIIRFVALAETDEVIAEPATTEAPPDSDTVPASDSTVPDTTVPDTTVPAASPDSTVPDSTVPDSTVPDSTVPDSTVPEVPERPVDALLNGQLGDLEDLGLIDLAGLSTASLAPGAAVRVVIVTDRTSTTDPATVLLALVSTLGDADDAPIAVVAEAGLPLDAADDDVERPASVVAAIRGSGRLRDEASTVDNAEDFPGWAAAVLAVRNAGVGDVGHYGHRDRSDRLLPRPLS